MCPTSANKLTVSVSALTSQAELAPEQNGHMVSTRWRAPEPLVYLLHSSAGLA